MTRISIRGILIAIPFMLVLDTIGGILLLTIFAGDQLPDGLNADQVHTAILAVTQSPGYLMGSLLFGSATTIFGAYLAARIARTYPYFNAAAFGLVAMLIGVIMENDAPFWYNAIAYTSTLPVALFGGHLAKKWLSNKIN
ncbi:MAG: hypothetical protein Q7T62_05990 [Undibacterium sp.]|nr:hypothetical protein [Undibacterium sp.]MDO8702325.1 hypothetical protein [Undibacterium sp.]